MIDSHTHLGSCAEPDAELVAQARAAGLTRLLTVGTNADSCRAALAAAEQFDEVYAAIGRHPNEATGYDASVLDERAAPPAPAVQDAPDTSLFDADPSLPAATLRIWPEAAWMLE